jgi:hypothetical protein
MDAQVCEEAGGLASERRWGQAALGWMRLGLPLNTMNSAKSTAKKFSDSHQNRWNWKGKFSRIVDQH